VLVQSTSAKIGDPVTAEQTANATESDAPVTDSPTEDVTEPIARVTDAEAAKAADTADTADTAAATPAITTSQAAVETMPIPKIEAGPDKDKKSWRAPGLDGVRALAVLSVLGFHEGLSWLPGGFLGVDVFFVLSGFLITDILVTKFGRDGNVGLRTFWQRRARRLLPALGLMLLTVTAAVTVLEPSQRGTLPPALLGAVTYTSNWWQAFAHLSYFSLYGPPPVFQHLWSLAVEEQFYLIWPLAMTAVLLLVPNRTLRVLFAWAAAAASAYVMFAVYVPGKDPSLVYYGTDTHASALLIGAALALTWPLKKVAAAAGRLRLSFDIVGAIGLLVLAWAVWRFSGADPFVYPYGLVIAALAAGGLVLAAAAPGRLGTMLSWTPLRWLGVRSYGIYLWHWPVIAITVGIDPRGAGTFGARVIDAILPIGLAAASWHWLEEPILRNGLRAELKRRSQLLLHAPKTLLRTPAVTGPAVFGAVTMIAVACTAGYGLVNEQTGPTLAQQISRDARVISSTQQQAPSATQSAAGQAEPWWLKAGAGVGPYRPNRHGRGPKPVRYLGAKVMAIGDSVMLASAPELAAAMPGIYINAQVSRAMIAGVVLVQDLAASKRLRKVVVVGLGTNGPIALSQVQQLRRAIGPHRWLLLVNTFVPRSWENEVNTTVYQAMHRYPNVMEINWHKAIEHHTDLLWSDGIHPMPIGGKLYAKVVRAAVVKALRHRPPTQRRKTTHRDDVGDGFLIGAKLG
jgi:peptidoglycan/LPS O-acetylase OafA/YrhL